MSEYQYYEFQAVDRLLTQREMAELRALSARATITPTRFTNVYNWGNSLCGSLVDSFPLLPLQFGYRGVVVR
jgi:hypothetical protein